MAAAAMEDHGHNGRQQWGRECDRTGNISQPEPRNLTYMPGILGMIAADFVAVIRLAAAKIQAVEDRLPDFQTAANDALGTLAAAQ
jgi:hypothetical protein